MNQADLELSPLATAFMAIVAMASLNGFVFWVRRWIKQGYVLAYEPRVALPWGAGAGLLAVLMTAIGVGNAIAMRGGDFEISEFSPSTFAENQFLMSAVQIAFAGAIIAVLVALRGASFLDLGWPTTANQLGRDVGLGVWIALASMVPLYVVQLLAIMILEIDPGHPLLDQMASTPDSLVFAAVMFAAVIAAPLFEEIVFRLLLQGGLERWEDARIAWPHCHSRVSHLETPDPSPSADELLDDAPQADAAHPIEPGSNGAVWGLAHGWAPILVSSFVFALAHLGNGPSPIALFAFAMFLGYAYQRTHRIVPSIVAHMVLNFISVVVMILTTTAA